MSAARPEPSPPVNPRGPLVLKVGGSILTDAQAYQSVAARLATLLPAGPTWCVVSAARGVTDRLQRLAKQDDEAEARRLLQQHECNAGAPVPSALAAALLDARRLARAGDGGPLQAWGEQSSAAALTARLQDLGVHVPIWELRVGARPGPGHGIVPGFYLRDRRGNPRLLPRGGTDISALLLARLLGARQVRLWKDGGGIHSVQSGGSPLPAISMDALLARLGDTIHPLHPAAVRIARHGRIPLVLEDPWGRHAPTLVHPEALP